MKHLISQQEGLEGGFMDELVQRKLATETRSRIEMFVFKAR